MVSDKEHQDYINLYKELVDRNNQKEIIIERMVNYIIYNAEKNKSMCNKDKIKKCNKKQCQICIRNYFERKR